MAFQYFTLDGNLFKDEVIEGFESFIWTERYNQVGDFQIITKSTYSSRQQLQSGVMLGMSESYYTMIVDTVVDKTDDSGIRNLTVTGKSLENLLNDRVAMPAVDSTTTRSKWSLTGPPADIARYIFTEICVNGVLSQYDTIPFYKLGTLLPSGTMPEPSTAVTISAAIDTLYNTLVAICQAYLLGFRLVRDDNAQGIYFEIYTGTDRTTDQSDVDPVIFSEDLDNLKDQEILTSTALVKTVAYVFAQNGSAVVYAPDADQTADGAGRRVLLVNSSNIATAGAELDAALQQEGLQALANQVKLYSFDGQLPQNTGLVYGTDYNLGDLVEERNKDGYGSQMVVTEQIFSSDNTGDHSYPTLAISSVITPGTWLSEDPNLVWSAVPSTTHWSDVT